MFESIQLQTMEVLSTIIAHLPNVIGSLFLLIAGWLVAGFLRMVISRLIRTVYGLIDKQLHGSNLSFV
ncbi:MAG: hypothetical protein Q8L06_18870, partial [Pseudohongiella sp.]|nr:hypothetical protein [Pseudohongiella sp.]